MPEFDDARRALDRARAAAADAKAQLLRARRQRSGIDREIGSLERTANAESGRASSRRLEALRREAAGLDADIAKLQSRSAAAETVRAERTSDFSRFSDPVKGVGNLPDAFPIALFPLRMETRFKSVTADGAVKHQLWVRVFPDDALVDAFQPDLALAEIDNARIYWTHVWRAGGGAAERKSAWRALAKASGSGRAKWIIDTYAPLNPGDEPVKSDGDHILVILPATPVPAAEKSAVATFWSAVWLSSGADRASAFADLAGAVGAARAAEIAATLVPANLNDVSVTPSQVSNVIVAFLDLPPASSMVSAPHAWSRGARSWLLPERLVLLGFNGGTETLHQVGNPIPSELQVGPDPSAPPDEQLKADGDDLKIPDALKWTVDFKTAVEVGMGFTVDITAAQARTGFDRLFVLGVRLASDAEKGAAEVATLIADHQRSRKGLAFLPQGTPTNNTDEASSGYTWWEDPAVSYRHFFEIDQTDDPDDWRLRKDGAWFAGLLGVDRAVMKASPGYFGTEQAEARAMNTGLWPATLGYFMEQMMESVFSDDDVTNTRAFFNRYVLGRGTIPAIRIGRQPYGVLPTTVYSRSRWFSREDYAVASRKGLAPDAKYMAGLHALIERAAQMWGSLAGDVAFVGKGSGDPAQILLDVIGLHPTSAEFHQRYAESLEQLYNRLKFSFLGLTASATEVARRYVESGLTLLAQLGWVRGSDPPPEILDKFFLRKPNLLTGLLVDHELSETSMLAAGRADGDNYLAWLQKAARTSHDALRRQAGFDGGPPTALLYLMLHHALDLGYIEASLFLQQRANLLDSAALRVARREPKFLHVAGAAADARSRWADLYRAEPALTGSATERVGDFIPTIIETMSPYLRSQLDALDILKTATTAALERAFVEAIDCCSYRLDAWRSALVGCQLSFMRGDADGALAKTGLLVGAYGWLEDVRPKPASPQPVTLDPKLAAIFQKPGDEPLVRDPTNRGHIHAPSLDHAVTAAILRNGFLVNATPDNPETLAINLTSERVRVAMTVIEGIRNGQPLGALLGYQLERSLHDSADLFLDRLIFALRKAFPLAGNRIKSTEDPDAPITAVEARNVVDGLAFIQHLEKTGIRTYPYGLAGLPALSDFTDTTSLSVAAIGAAIDARVERMLSVNDAVADLAMAEGVFQVVKGNYDRAAGTLDAISKGNFPPIPEVAVTPRSGRTLIHRVALHLEGGLDPSDPGNPTPRAKGEPALNRWLRKHLPPMTEIFAAVEYFDHATSATRRLTPAMADLGLEPIDLFYLVDEGSVRGMPGLDGLMLHHAMSQTVSPPRADTVLSLIYKPDAVPGLTLFEVAPLLRGLRGLILGSRPLIASDLMLAGEANRGADASVVARPEKVARVIADLQAKSADTVALAAALDSAVGAGADPVSATAAALAGLDQWSTDYAAALAGIAPFGLRAASLSAAHEQARPLFATLHAQVSALVARWEGKLQDFKDAIDAYDALPAATPDDERFPLLIRAGRIVSTEVIAPLPPTAGDMRLTMPGLQTGFETALNQLRAIRNGGERLGTFFAAISSFAPIAASHDQAPFDLNAYPPAILAIARDLAGRSAEVGADITARLDTANGLLATVAAAPLDKQAGLVADAMHAILGDAFVVLPEFALAAERLAEWQNAWTAKAGLLAHLTTDPTASPFPVDDWLHGLGRVRDKLRHLEMAGLLGDALTAPQSLDLTPLQFPYRPNDAWLGLKFPATLPDGTPFRLDGDRLLYTAHFGENAEITPADPARIYCGFLIDEWSELIPADQETTGLVFHYDRPSSEAPQAILLATPPDFTGAWQWTDLVDTLHETLDFARLRAVEPARIDQTDLARFLPAVISSVTMFPITAALNFAQNNALAGRLAEPSHE